MGCFPVGAPGRFEETIRIRLRQEAVAPVHQSLQAQGAGRERSRHVAQVPGPQRPRRHDVVREVAEPVAQR
jgi:hypothetical protein